MTTYSINSGSEIHGVQSTWQKVPIRQEANGAYTYNNWQINEWRIPVMTMGTFETLKAAEGDTLTSLDTNDTEDLNAGATYETVIMESLVNGRHTALNVENVTIRFRVDVNA